MAEKRESVISVVPSSIRTRPTFHSAPSQQALLGAPFFGIEPTDGMSTVSGGSTLSGRSGRTSSADESLTTMKVLQNFDEVVARRSDPELMKKRRERRAKCKSLDGPQRQNCQRLRNWVDGNQRRARPILSALRLYRAPPLPDDKDLIELARHFYPPRWKLTVHVCDFGDNRAERFEVPLSEIENCWQERPDWATVRWIHAPLGLGLVHSSVEDLFLHTKKNPGRAFEHAGSPGWPYPETEVLNFRSRQNVQDMRDTFMILSELAKSKPQLNFTPFEGDVPTSDPQQGRASFDSGEQRDWSSFDSEKGRNPYDAVRNNDLRYNIKWRAHHHGATLGYWNLVESDMPWQISEGIVLGQLGPKGGLKSMGREIDKQALSKHPSFEKAQLVRNMFRCFHRADGCLLTLSAAVGIDYLDKDFPEYLEDPIQCILENDDASAIGRAFQAFAETGTSTWHRKTVDWFLVYLITEVGVTPHTYRQGHNAVSVVTAYQHVVQDLKRRRYDPWRRNETVLLVREYLACIDELTAVCLILTKKIELFEGLKRDCRKFERDDIMARKEPDDPEGVSAEARASWAIMMVKEQHDACKKLLADLQLSMNALFQLRSIEQNELAVVADNQNKAILVFTAVTIIFLPLSFFTSYWGMNLNGMSENRRTEAYFWKVEQAVVAEDAAFEDGLKHLGEPTARLI
ncbi:MAG: hypothetical protein M1839_002796 [Geoglossum umbratile]|nr:MAG: hypothetical protein M1839_002796 [Geoglossum umbratile]